MLWDEANTAMWDVERLRIATNAAGVALWSWNVDTDRIVMDEHAHELWGMPIGALVTFQSLSAHILLEDLDRVTAAFKAIQATWGAFEIDFPILGGRQIRWISARGQGQSAGFIGRDLFSLFLDVTARKQAEDAREMLVTEMSHRVKNLFAIATALTAIAARSTATTTEMAHDLTQRLTALGRAHDLVRPVAGDRGPRVAGFGELLTVLLSPYDDQRTIGGRIQVSVPNVPVGETGATTLALVVHELATNSVKYGALSAADGVLDVACTVHADDVLVVWTERKGPPVAASCKPAGFGSKLVTQSMSGQLGGSIAFNWAATGVVITLTMSKAHLAR